MSPSDAQPYQPVVKASSPSRRDAATAISASADKGLSAFVVSMKSPGITIKRLEAHGLNGNSFGGMSLKDVFVKDELLLGGDGKGYNLFTNHFQYWRLMQAASAIGTGERALELMVERIKAREAFGAPIGRFAHLQQPIGQYRTELSMALAFAREAAEHLDRGDYKTAHAMISGIKAEGVRLHPIQILSFRLDLRRRLHKNKNPPRCNEEGAFGRLV